MKTLVAILLVAMGVLLLFAVLMLLAPWWELMPVVAVYLYAMNSAYKYIKRPATKEKD